MEYHLKALEKFVCLGTECPDTCCQGSWLIEIDENAMTKWQALVNTDEREALFGSVQELEDGTRTFFREYGKCIHLTEEGLCSIQLKYGDSLLPEVCREYPRLSKGMDSNELRSAKLSCPEIARLVLLEKTDGDLFDWTGLSAAELPGNFLSGTRQQYFDQFDRLVTGVMGQKKSWLTNRLYHIVLILCEYKGCTGDMSAKLTMLERRLKSIKTDLYQVNLELKGKRYKTNPPVVASVWASVFNLCMQSGYFRNQDWFTSTQAYIAMMSVKDANFSSESLDHFYNVIKDISLKTRPVFRRELTDILDNYLRVTFRNKGFPWSPVNDNQAATFLNVIVPFSIVNLLCWLRYEATGSLSRDFLIDVIWKIERDIGQSNLIYDHIFSNPHMLELDEYKEFFTDLC